MRLMVDEVLHFSLQLWNWVERNSSLHSSWEPLRNNRFKWVQLAFDNPLTISNMETRLICRESSFQGDIIASVVELSGYFGYFLPLNCETELSRDSILLFSHIWEYSSKALGNYSCFLSHTKHTTTKNEINITHRPIVLFGNEMQSNFVVWQERRRLERKKMEQNTRKSSFNPS